MPTMDAQPNAPPRHSCPGRCALTLRNTQDASDLVLTRNARSMPRFGLGRADGRTQAKAEVSHDRAPFPRARVGGSL